MTSLINPQLGLLLTNKKSAEMFTLAPRLHILLLDDAIEARFVQTIFFCNELLNFSKIVFL